MIRPFIDKASNANPVLLAFICYAAWGFAALVYLPMHAFHAGPIEIIAHRCIWAFLLSGALVIYFKQVPEVVLAFKDVRLAGLLLLSSLLMSSNWGIFIWAVLHGHIIESSLGYYINPLMNMAVGTWLFRERLDKFGIGAIVLAIIGVAIQAVALGHIPFVALSLAISFTIYGVIRKRVAVNALPGLFIECLYLVLPALIYFVWFELSGQGHFFVPVQAFWLMLTGPVTVIPLVMFSHVARRLPLSTMGFIQFVGPTIGFFIGLSQGEPFTPMRALSFTFIWIGAVVFAAGAYFRFRDLKTSIEGVK